MSKELNINQLSEYEGAIKYYPCLRRKIGSVNAAILLQSAIDAHIEADGSFSRFKEPCDHSDYSSGESWCEKLGFTRREIDTALKRLGRRVTANTPLKGDEKHLITWRTSRDNITTYTFHENNFKERMEVLG